MYPVEHIFDKLEPVVRQTTSTWDRPVNMTLKNPDGSTFGTGSFSGNGGYYGMGELGDVGQRVLDLRWLAGALNVVRRAVPAQAGLCPLTPG
jgi:hypothetical protein